MTKRKQIDVPDIPGGTMEVCFKQNLHETRTYLSRCDRLKGHRGLHTFQFIDKLEAAGLMKPPKRERGSRMDRR